MTAAARAPRIRNRLKLPNPYVLLSLFVILVILTCALLAPVLAPYDASAIDLRSRLKPPAWVEGGSSKHLLGTDATGRDILSRILYGGRVSLAIGLTACLLGALVGTPLGLLSGYARGAWDQVIMYLVDLQLSMPFLLLAIAVSLVLGSTVPVLIGIAALSTWPYYARVVRGAVLSLRDQEFVTSAVALGSRPPRVMFRHLLPSLVSPIIVLLTLNLGRIVLLESGLSFLGIGVRPPTPSWGNMIDDGRSYLNTAWWISIMPSMALMALTMAVGTVGDWLRDKADVATAE